MPYKYFKIAEYDGHGGPAQAVPSESMTPTTFGRYVIASIGKHKSGGRWMFSTIEWGTPLRISGGRLQIQQNKVWINISSVGSFKKAYNGDESKILNDVKELYASYKNQSGEPIIMSSTEQLQDIPPTWLFNDFGHVAIKYYKDLNGNYKFDNNEKIMPDFIHTVPNNEFQFSHGVSDFDLGSSHGCIHARPDDIDAFIALGYAKVGSVIEVHAYSETFVPNTLEKPIGKPPYEIHFYPGALRQSKKNNGNLPGKIIIYKVDLIN